MKDIMSASIVTHGWLSLLCKLSICALAAASQVLLMAAASIDAASIAFVSPICADKWQNFILGFQIHDWPGSTEELESFLRVLVYLYKIDPDAFLIQGLPPDYAHPWNMELQKVARYINPAICRWIDGLNEQNHTVFLPSLGRVPVLCVLLQVLHDSLRKGGKSRKVTTLNPATGRGPPWWSTTYNTCISQEVIDLLKDRLRRLEQRNVFFNSANAR